MATVNLWAGCSETFDLTRFVSTATANGAVATSASNPHNQQQSLKCTANTGGTGRIGIAQLRGTSQANGRLSTYWQFDRLPDSIADGSFTKMDGFLLFQDAGGNVCFALSIDPSGNLRLMNSANNTAVTGSTVLTASTLYRITFAWTVTSGAVNDFRVFINGTQEITATNISARTAPVKLYVGPIWWDSTTGASNHYFTDIYLDDSNALTDPGDIRCTAKRPFANGTTNGFSTTGSGSGYGTGNAAFVNERPLGTTNFVSVVGAGSAVTEEYNIEPRATGDDAMVGTIVDYAGWLYAKSLSSETGQIILNNATSNISLTSSNTMFAKVAGSTTYPAGTGTDIGIVTDTSLTTVSLFEAGIIFAYIPGAAGGAAGPWRTLLGVGM